MADARIPDPTLMARLQLSVKGIDWAAGLVKPWQHDAIEDTWAPHHQLAHLIAVETENFQPRILRIVNEDSPVLDPWDTDASGNFSFAISADASMPVSLPGTLSLLLSGLAALSLVGGSASTRVLREPRG